MGFSIDGLGGGGNGDNSLDLVLVDWTATVEKTQAVAKKKEEPKRPKFQDMWDNHQKLAHDDLATAGKKIGGNVQKQIDGGNYQDGCALRMSSAFNNSGVSFKDYFRDHPNAWLRASGGDGQVYMPRSSEMKEFIIQQYGKPDKVVSNPHINDLQNFKGIVLFEADGMRHIDLWDGKDFSAHGKEYLITPHADGKEYADDPRKNMRISIWSLPDK